MKKTLGPFVILLVATALFFGACRGGQEKDPQEMQIRTYELPEGVDARKFRSYLAGSLKTGEQSLGTVRTYPDGSLVVTAPVSVHDGIETLLADMFRRGPAKPEPTPSSVTVSYWFLLGRPQEGGGEKAVGPALRQNEKIQPVLKEIVSAHGSMEFRLLEAIQLQSLDTGIEAEARGRRASVKQEIMRHGSGGWLSDIVLTAHGKQGFRHYLRSRVRLEPGRFVVLGQTAFNDEQGEGMQRLEGNGDGSMLYYVISSEID